MLTEFGQEWLNPEDARKLMKQKYIPLALNGYPPHTGEVVNNALSTHSAKG